MCGRMTLTSDNWVTVAQELRATGSPETMASLRPRFNVAPTQSHPVVMLGQERNVLGLAQWGFPGNQQTPLVINARAETIASRPMFKSALTNHRCVVVADGFIEWRKTPTGRQPLWFRRGEGMPLYLAGLFTPAGATTIESPARFVVVTTAPNQLVAAVHDRMPAVLSPEDALRWLASPKLDLLAPAPETWLQGTEVSTRINSAAQARNRDDLQGARPRPRPGQNPGWVPPAHTAQAPPRSGRKHQTRPNRLLLHRNRQQSQAGVAPQLRRGPLYRRIESSPPWWQRQHCC